LSAARKTALGANSYQALTCFPETVVNTGFPAAMAALNAGANPSPIASKRAAMHGAVAAAVGITTKTCWTIAHPYFKGRDGQIRVVLIAAVAFALYVFAHIPPIWVLILAAGVGAFLPEPRP
jgi:chromate transport protein ChrA